ncbi:hypothetical protein MBLNU457_4267t1 [Dothideomycetes sp. NU457]
MKKRSPTAWLDGCRGYAAVIVVIFHFLLVFLPSIRFGYGMELPVGHLVFDNVYVSEGAVLVRGTFGRPDRWKITDPSKINNYHWYQLPIIRVLLAGDSMVNIFFVVSGYALSIKSLKLIRKAARAELCSSLASSLWRRPLRLFAPTLVSTLLVAIMAGAGMFDTSYRTLGYDKLYSPHPVDFIGERRKYFKGPQWEEPPPWKPNMSSQLLDWVVTMYYFLCPWLRGHPFMTFYDWHIWTIPVEYKASLVLYMTHAVFALVHARYRTHLLIILLVAATAFGDIWEQCLFWGGMLLCNMDLDRAKRISHHTAPSRVMQTLWISILFVSLFLMSYPELEPNMVPWCAWISKIYLWDPWYHDRYRTVQGIGACLFIYVVPRLTYLKAFFSNDFARYLGRISYSLYLVHGPVFRSLGYAVFLKVLKGSEFDRPRYYTAVAISMAVSLPVTFGLAHLFRIFVDEPLVHFARWTEKLVFVQNDSQEVQWRKQDPELSTETSSLLPMHHESGEHELVGVFYTDEKQP